MNDAAAFAGSYADLKFIKTRSVFQVIVEMPIEQADAFLKAFKAPQPGQERPVALALLNRSGPPSGLTLPGPPPEPQAVAQEGGQATAASRRPWSDLPYATQAALRCQDQQFQEWLWHEAGQRAGDFPTDTDGNGPDWENWTKETVRLKCGVITRADIKKGTQAGVNWLAIETAFRQATGRETEDRS